jgi:ribosomal protein S14
MSAMLTIDERIERFFSKVQKTDGCWHWTGASNHLSYGQMLWIDRVVNATRISWWIHHGYMPMRHEHVCHRCDVPSCVRPDHLFLGSARDNVRDCIQKGRFKFLAARSGVKNNKAKMTRAKVRKARRMREQGATISAIAREFGLARSTTREIVYGRNWRFDPDVVTVPRGKTSAKLTDEQREEVRRIVAGKSEPIIYLARRLNVGRDTILRTCGLR